MGYQTFWRILFSNNFTVYMGKLPIRSSSCTCLHIAAPKCNWCNYNKHTCVVYMLKQTYLLGKMLATLHCCLNRLFLQLWLNFHIACKKICKNCKIIFWRWGSSRKIFVHNSSQPRISYQPCFNDNNETSKQLIHSK